MPAAKTKVKEYHVTYVVGGFYQGIAHKINTGGKKGLIHKKITPLRVDSDQPWWG